MKQITRTASVEGEPKASDLWRTPPELFAALDAEFAFTVDLAASLENALCDCFLGPGAGPGLSEDALAVSWVDENLGRRGFLNPPYSAKLIVRFVEKAAREAAAGFMTVALLPCDPSTRWWQFTRSAVEIREIPHRVGYLKADGTTKAGAMFPSCVVVFRPQPGIVRAQPRRVVWTYRQARSAWEQTTP